MRVYDCIQQILAFRRLIKALLETVQTLHDHVTSQSMEIQEVSVGLLPLTSMKAKKCFCRAIDNLTQEIPLGSFAVFTCCSISGGSSGTSGAVHKPINVLKYRH